jgi:uncharacterized RDD family membrane protein YckC
VIDLPWPRTPPPALGVFLPIAPALVCAVLGVICGVLLFGFADRSGSPYDGPIDEQLFFPIGGIFGAIIGFLIGATCGLLAYIGIRTVRRFGNASDYAAAALGSALGAVGWSVFLLRSQGVTLVSVLDGGGLVLATATVVVASLWSHRRATAKSTAIKVAVDR